VAAERILQAAIRGMLAARVMDYCDWQNRRGPAYQGQCALPMCTARSQLVVREVGEHSEKIRYRPIFCLIWLSVNAKHMTHSLLGNTNHFYKAPVRDP
jgi:hypothetical protein